MVSLVSLFIVRRNVWLTTILWHIPKMDSRIAKWLESAKKKRVDYRRRTLAEKRSRLSRARQEVKMCEDEVKNMCGQKMCGDEVKNMCGQKMCGDEVKNMCASTHRNHNEIFALVSS